MSLLERLKVNGNINTPVKESVDKVDTKKSQALKAKVEKENAAKAKVAKAKSASTPRSVGSQKQCRSAQQSLKSGGKGLGGLLNAGGSHGGQTQQGNVNPDGSRSSNSDNLGEEWRRNNGYHY